MKKILLSIVAIYTWSFNLHAQSYSTQWGDSSTGWHQSSGGEFNVHNNILNNLPDPIWIKWRIVDHDITPGWLFKGVCDNRLCYGEDAPGLLDGTASQVSFPYLFNQPGDLHAIFNGDAAPNNSAAWIQILAEDTTNNDVKTLTFIGRKGPLGIQHVSAVIGINLYPNPAGSQAFLFCDAQIDLRNVQIIDFSGRVISTHNATGSVTKLSLEELSPGMYCVRLNGKDGKTFTTLLLSHF